MTAEINSTADHADFADWVAHVPRVLVSAPSPKRALPVVRPRVTDVIRELAERRQLILAA
jgi:hypothetical protein